MTTVMAPEVVSRECEDYDCDTTFRVKRHSTKRFCDHHAKLRRLEQERKRKRSIRKAAQLGVDVNHDSGHDDRRPVMAFQLKCGHEVLFRVAPLVGEHLYCVRCADWHPMVGESQ